MCKYLLVATLILGTVLCQDQNAILNDLKDQLPPGFEGAVNETQQEEVKKLLKEKCDKNGGEGAFDDIVNSKDYIQTCFESQINTTLIMEELEEAKKDGSMDEVFGKYCKKRSNIMACVTNVTKKIERCLEPSERDNLKIVLNVTESLADFVCYKDGDRLAMFVAEGGFECLQDHKDQLQQCVNKTIAGRIPADLSATNLPLFVIGKNECDDMMKLQQCAIAELETCKDNTPANIVEALFKFIKRVTPCSKTKSLPPASALSLKDEVPDKTKRSGGVDFAFIKGFDSKCRKYAGPTAYRDLETSVTNLKTCVKLNLKAENACGRLPTEIKNCTNSVINKLRVCLPPQESYLPNFAHSSVDSVLRYLCDENGKNFNKLIHSGGGLPCLLGNDPKSLNDCLSGTKTRRTKDSDIVTKAELCEDLDKIRLCLSTYITNHCHEMLDFKQVTLGIMDAIRTPCAACSVGVSSAVMIISLFFATTRYLL